MKRAILLLLALIYLLIVACVSTPIRQAVEKKYTSNIPPLEVEFAYQIENVKEHGNDAFLKLATTEVRGIWVDLLHTQVHDNILDYYYSVQGIASNSGFHYHDPIYFNDHQWVKVSKVNDNGYLMCGYFTRKGKWLLFIHNSVKLTSSEMDRHREYQRTLKLSEQDKKFIDTLFAELEKAIVSIQ